MTTVKDKLPLYIIGAVLGGSIGGLILINSGYSW